jgi:hypothetical protein
MTDKISPYEMSDHDLATHLGNCGWWERLRGASANAAAALRLHELADTCTDLHKRLAGQEQAFNKERNAYERKAKEEAKSLYQRTLMAIAELEAYKKNGRSEVAVAVILSPSQYGELTCHGAFRTSKIANLGIYVARGVYGPVVLTQDGFNGFTRMAPELDIRAKNPTNGHDW